jgi:hypothetical protein
VQRDTVGAARIGVDLEPRIGAVDWELLVTKVSFVEMAAWEITMRVLPGVADAIKAASTDRKL